MNETDDQAKNEAIRAGINPVEEVSGASILSWTNNISDSKSIHVTYSPIGEKPFHVRQETRINEGRGTNSTYRDIEDDEMVDFVIAVAQTLPDSEYLPILKTLASQRLHRKLESARSLIGKLNNATNHVSESL